MEGGARQSGGEQGPQPDEKRLRLVLIATSMAIFAVQLDFFALNLSLPGMASDLGVSTDDIQWVISGYMLALGAFLIPGGRLGDLLGRKRMLIWGLAIFGGSSLAGGLAGDANLLIAARIVQGVGAAVLFPVAIAVITNAFPPERQMRAIGNAYGLGAIATAAGPFVGGGLTELADWRWVLLINVPIALMAIWLVIRSVEESRDSNAPRQIDLPGIALVVAGVAAVTFAVDRSTDWGFASPDTLALLAVGLLLLVGFVTRERATDQPLVDLVLFKNGPYVKITLLGTVANVAFVAATFAITLYLQRVEDYSPLVAGLIFIAASLPLAAAGPVSGRLAERFHIPTAMAIASFVGAAGLLIVATGSGLTLYLIGLALFGGGYGIGWSMVSVGTQSVVAPDRAGEASGVTLAIVIGVAGLFVAISAAAIAAATADGSDLGGTIEVLLRVLAIGSVIAAAALLATARPGAALGGLRPPPSGS